MFEDASGLLFGPGVFATVRTAPQILHLLLAAPYKGFVLCNLEFLAVNNAGPLRPRPVPVVRVLLHVQLRQLRLLFIELLLRFNTHGFPTRSEDL